SQYPCRPPPGLYNPLHDDAWSLDRGAVVGRRLSGRSSQGRCLRRTMKSACRLRLPVNGPSGPFLLGRSSDPPRKTAIWRAACAKQAARESRKKVGPPLDGPILATKMVTLDA